MSGIRCQWIAFLAAGVVLVGCVEPTARLNAPPQGEAAIVSQVQPFFTYMGDNAMMSDVSIADIHFVPHTTELNSLGTIRLTRMSTFLGTYGGTVRYDTRSKLEELVDQRLAHVRDFLATTGIDMSRIDVQVAMAGSDHTEAAQAMEAARKGEEWTTGQQELWFPSSTAEKN